MDGPKEYIFYRFFSIHNRRGGYVIKGKGIVRYFL